MMIYVRMHIQQSLKKKTDIDSLDCLKKKRKNQEKRKMKDANLQVEDAIKK